MDILKYEGSIIGLGGLGCPALIHLVENWPENIHLHLKLLDNDHVELSNLNRQILFNSNDIGKSKAETAILKIRQYLKDWPQNISLEANKVRLDNSNINQLLSKSHFILDCTDDVPCKLLLNDYALARDKILVYGGVQGTEGIVQLICSGLPCLICNFGDMSSEEACELGGACRSGGVIGSIAGMTAIHQVNLLLSTISEKTDSTRSELIMINELGQSRHMTTTIDPSCSCGCIYTPRKKINLSHLSCPETFLFSKLSLEKVKSDPESRYAQIFFSSEEDLKNVSHSLLQENNKIVKTIIKPECLHFSVIVQLKDLNVHMPA